MPLMLVFLVACTALAAGDEPAYCTVRYRRLCQGKGRHVACQFPFPGPGPSCRNYTQINFDRELQQFVTNYINRRRQRVAAGHERVRGGARLPRPRIMMFVEWDRELALLAQRLADQCEFAHDDCRATVRYPYAGQTVGEVRLRGGARDELHAPRAVRRVLDAWWGERRRAEPRQLVEPFHITSKGSVWGHFSQLAVWSLRAVGCGAARHGAARARLLLVCDFSHTNMLGQRTLEPGALASCPDHSRRRPHSAFPLLCAAIRYDTSETVDDAPNTDTDEYSYENEEDFVTETTTRETEASKESRRRPENRRTMTEASEDVGRRVTDSFYDKLAVRLKSSKRQKQKGEERRVLGTTDRAEYDRKYSAADSLRELHAGDQRRKSYGKIDPEDRAIGFNVPTPMLRPTSLFVMDKDVADQLFKDTGFLPAWKQNIS